MMKRITLLPYFLTLIGSVFAQSKNVKGFVVLSEESNTAKYFKMGKLAYLDYYSLDKVKFGQYDYHQRLRVYSWGKIDTSYFREDDTHYLHFDHKNQSESVVLPKRIELGQKWYESDRSWSYEVIGLDEKLKTPFNKYKGLIVVECVQLTGRDKEKSKVYHMYYGEGIGLIASVNNKQLTSYLAEIKTKPQDGDKIGN